MRLKIGHADLGIKHILEIAQYLLTALYLLISWVIATLKITYI